jgi:cyclohexadienyl dehydratase
MNRNMKPMKLATLLLPLLLGAGPAMAQLAPGPGAAPAAVAATTSQLDTIMARGVLRVGVTGDYRPFSIKTADGGLEGLDVDMAGSLATALGVKLELVPTTWGTLLADLKAGRFDVGMGGISVTLERQRQALFSAPVLRTGKAPIALCTNQARFGTMEGIDRPDVRAIVNPGGTNERFARATLKQAQIVVFPSNAAIFDELVAGRADVMMTDSVETRLQAKLHPELCAINPDRPLDFGELAYLLPRDAVLKDFVDQWLHISTETGERARLAAKWIP